MRYLPHLLKQLRKYHTGWNIAIIDLDDEEYINFTLTEDLTDYEQTAECAEVEIDSWEVDDDNGKDQPTIYLYSNIKRCPYDLPV